MDEEADELEETEASRHAKYAQERIALKHAGKNEMGNNAKKVDEQDEVEVLNEKLKQKQLTNTGAMKMEQPGSTEKANNLEEVELVSPLKPEQKQASSTGVVKLLKPADIKKEIEDTEEIELLAGLKRAKNKAGAKRKKPSHEEAAGSEEVEVLGFAWPKRKRITRQAVRRELPEETNNSNEQAISSRTRSRQGRAAATRIKRYFEEESESESSDEDEKTARSGTSRRTVSSERRKTGRAVAQSEDLENGNVAGPVDQDKSSAECKFRNGEIVWAQSEKSPYWPGKIYSIIRSSGKNGALVIWLGVDTYSPCIEFTRLDKFVEMYAKRFNPKRKEVSYHKAVAEGIVACLPCRGYFERNLSSQVHRSLVKDHEMQLDDVFIIRKRRKKMAGGVIAKRRKLGIKKEITTELTEPATEFGVDLMPKQSDVVAPEKSNVATPEQSSAQALEQSNTVGAEQSDTLVPGQSNTVAPGESNTVAPGESNTVAPGQSDTVAPGRSNTIAPEQSNVVAPEQSDVVSPRQSGMVASGQSDVVAPEQSNAVAPEQSDMGQWDAVKSYSPSEEGEYRDEEQQPAVNSAVVRYGSGYVSDDEPQLVIVVDSDESM
ncbi:unnamed protein product [Gongylonema pulchrum]|uniref:PWWP domain-containing protein n=1 Tax=Gongylonema pulchrum TaxID=637853 RepID=A0A183DP54_9BILA|nr:unnamed protein product [Gongylonema pulchrum]